MKEFLKKLLSEGDAQSSKRFSALLTLLVYLALTFVTVFKSEGILPEYIQDGLLMIIIGGLGLTSIEKIFKKEK
jgi:hypothetical protein